MATGMIARFDSALGYGFITPDDGSADVFVHMSAVARGTDGRKLRRGMRVTYEALASERGPKAASVCAARGEEEPVPVPEEPDQGYSDVLTENEFREQVAVLLEEAVARLIGLARSHGWVE